MHDSLILFEEIPGRGGNLGLITLNRPRALNALSHEMVVLIHQKLLEWEEAYSIKAVVIRATEGRAFCAGGDLRSVYEKHQQQDPLIVDFFRDEYRLNHCIHHYSKPYIAFLDGITMGGGAGISLHGSHCIGTERLIFAMPETGIGFFPDVGGTYFLPRLSGRWGYYLGLTGAQISCDDSLALDLINYKFPQENLHLALSALADTAFGDDPRESVSAILRKFHIRPEHSPLMAEAEKIQEHFGKDTVEDIFTSLETSSETWCKNTLDSLKTKSPTSLRVSFQALQEGIKRDFDQCMQMEYHLTCHFVQHHDFYEGIRALIIDKEGQPKWQPSELSAISQQSIESYFMPLQGKEALLLFD